MTSIFTFPGGIAAEASSAAEAAGYLSESYGRKFNPKRAKRTEEPGDDEFHAKYGEPDDHGKTLTGNPQTLETFGEEFEKVEAIHRENPRRVWTIIDCEDGLLRLSAGLHIVNRLNYLTTTIPWENENECYVW